MKIDLLTFKQHHFCSDRIKVITLLIILFVVFPLSAFAFHILSIQCDNDIMFNADSQCVELIVDDNLIDENSVFFRSFDERPEFPGGRKAFSEYLIKNMEYPADALKDGVEGGVLVQFIVEKDGAITNTEVLRGVSATIDAEAMRLISQMPNWMPGVWRDTVRRVQMVRLVDFQIKDYNHRETGPDEVDTDQIVEVSMDTANNEILQDEDGLFLQVPVMPEYPGGEALLLNYLRKAQVYPEDALHDRIEGRVIVQFIVEKDGSISSPIIIQNLYPSLDAEAIRIITSMPNWNPGKIEDRACRVRYSLPISFRVY